MKKNLSKLLLLPVVTFATSTINDLSATTTTPAPQTVVPPTINADNANLINTSTNNSIQSVTSQFQGDMTNLHKQKLSDFEGSNKYNEIIKLYNDRVGKNPKQKLETGGKKIGDYSVEQLIKFFSDKLNSGNAYVSIHEKLSKLSIDDLKNKITPVSSNINNSNGLTINSQQPSMVVTSNQQPPMVVTSNQQPPMGMNSNEIPQVNQVDQGDELYNSYISLIRQYKLNENVAKVIFEEAVNRQVNLSVLQQQYNQILGCLYNALMQNQQN